MKVLVTATTQMELYYLTSVVTLLRREKSDLECHLLIRKQMCHALCEEIKTAYTKIVPMNFPREKYLLGGLFFGAIFWFKINRLLSAIAYDFIFINSFRELFANIVCGRAGEGTKLIAFCNTNPFKDDLFEKKRCLSSLRSRILSGLLGYSIVDYLWSSDGENIIYKEYRSYPYNLTVYFSESDVQETGAVRALPPPFFALKELVRSKPKIPAKSILVVGERTPLYPSWSSEDERKFADFMSFLKKSFPDHKLYFKPRPGITDLSKIDLSGFELLPSRGLLEELFLLNKFDKVISMKSTASVTATFFGHPGYHLYHMFDCPPDFRAATDDIYEGCRTLVRLQKNEDIFQVPEVAHSGVDVGEKYAAAIFGASYSN